MYLVVGDSHAARFDGLILEHPAGPIVVKARWQPLARVGDLFQDGRISEPLTRVLMEMRHLRRADEGERSPFPALPEPSPYIADPVNYVPRNAERLVLMFTIGEANLFDIAHELYPVFDFDLDPNTPGLERIPPDDEWHEKIDADTVRRVIRERCNPLFNAMLTLRAAGYRHLFFHDIVPPSLERRQHWKPYRLRFKLAVLFNEIYAEFARSNGVGFVSLWNVLLVNGLRSAEYDQDGVHLNRAAAAVSINRLHEQLVDYVH